jgi:hypothetical protein
MPRYKPMFAVGSNVRILDRASLEYFKRIWEFHNNLKQAQLDYADRIAKIASSGIYPRGDVTYELEGVPGIWHEECLDPFE